MNSSALRREAVDIAKIVLPIVFAVVGSAWRLSVQIDNMERFGWTLHDQREWARQIHALNPAVVVPDPNDIFWDRRPAASTRLKSILPDGLAKEK